VKERILEIYMAYCKLAEGRCARLSPVLLALQVWSRTSLRPLHSHRAGSQKFVRVSLGGIHDEAESGATAEDLYPVRFGRIIRR